MLRPAEAHEIEAYMDTAYALALDPSRSGYPLFSDGILTKEQFVRWAWESFQKPDRALLLFCLPDGQIAGWIQYFWIAEDRYLQTDGFLIARSRRRCCTRTKARAARTWCAFTPRASSPPRWRWAFAAPRGTFCSKRAFERAPKRRGHAKARPRLIVLESERYNAKAPGEPGGEIRKQSTGARFNSPEIRGAVSATRKESAGILCGFQAFLTQWMGLLR